MTSKIMIEGYVPDSSIWKPFKSTPQFLHYETFFASFQTSLSDTNWVEVYFYLLAKPHSLISASKLLLWLSLVSLGVPIKKSKLTATSNASGMEYKVT